MLYASLIQSSAPEAYEQLIRGPYQWLVYMQFLFIGLLFIGTYLVLRARFELANRLDWIDAVFVISTIGLVASVGHTAVRRAWLYVLVLLMISALWQWASTIKSKLEKGLSARPVAVGLGVVAVLTYLTMGTIRETTRHPDTVRNVISLQDEAKYPAALREAPKTFGLRTERTE